MERTPQLIDRSGQVQNRAVGAILGHLVGDAFGVPYEFCAPEDLPKHLEWHGYRQLPAGNKEEHD